MATDFMTALRSRAREQERGARLSGRPQTEVEAAAPYVAMAETASERNARAKALALQESAQGIQQGQFGQTLEFNRLQQAENLKLEQDRLAAQKEQEAARLDEIKRTTNLQVEAAEKAREQAEKQGALTGAVSGALGGFYVGGPPGAIIGGTIGLFAGKKGCIIISACTDPHSYEVELSRIFRDRYMGPETLIGYYRLASLVAPLIDKFRSVRWVTRMMLVKRLVDYGEWILGMKYNTARPMSHIVTKAFLGLCQRLGKGVK